MKAISKLLGAAMLIVLGTAFQAQALPITPSTLNIDLPGDFPHNNNDLIDFLASFEIFGLLYKAQVGGSDEGTFAANYTTTFLNSASDPSGANIVYDGNGEPFITPAPGKNVYLVVKDGNHAPFAYLFNLTALGWNGTEVLALSGFWPNGGAISNLQILNGPSTQVPDGGSTPMLLSVTLMSLVVVRRKFNC